MIMHLYCFTSIFLGNTTEKCFHKDRTADNCTAVFAIETFDNGTTLVHVQKEKGKLNKTWACQILRYTETCTRKLQNLYVFKEIS